MLFPSLATLMQHVVLPAEQHPHVSMASQTEAEPLARAGESVEHHLIMPDNVKLARDVTVPNPSLVRRSAQSMGACHRLVLCSGACTRPAKGIRDPAYYACVQGAMFVSDAMMIPSASLGTSLKQAGGEGGPNGRGAVATRAAATGTSWVGPSWPLAGSTGMSLGRGMPALGMGTSPFGKSVDMVDVCTQLMEGAHAVPFCAFCSRCPDLVDSPPCCASKCAGGACAGRGKSLRGMCCITGHTAHSFCMGSLRSDLQLPVQSALLQSTGEVEGEKEQLDYEGSGCEDDDDEDIMLLGTTPQVRLANIVSPSCRQDEHWMRGGSVVVLPFLLLTRWAHPWWVVRRRQRAPWCTGLLLWRCPVLMPLKCQLSGSRTGHHHT